jgi:6-pyruvoyltetrahydropterin/6-carboxytetrahydropterin synthase
MYSLAVSDHVMIAHSFRGDIFGPAQQLHGATYGVELEFRRPSLDDNGLVCDIGLALQVLREVLGEFNFKNLDELPQLKGRNTTTEFMAGEIFARVKARVAQGGVGPGTAGELASLRVVLRESPVAWAAFDGPLR